MSRSCARPGCSDAAVATLSYAYAQSAVWLRELADESHPMTHDLCLLHADGVKVPRGWDLFDARNGFDVRNEPSGSGAGGAGDGTPDAPHRVPAVSRADRVANGAALRLVGA